MKITGQIVDVNSEEIYPGEIIFDKKIKTVRKITSAPKRFILPGLVNAHVHIESSMLIPSEFARLAVKHGTVATVSDPHEIANVCGINGVEFMLKNSRKVPFKFYFGASSCVPATGFETSGANLGPKEIEKLLSRKEILYLSEVMNYPGVINCDPEVMKKIAIAKEKGKRIDGHAPGVMGADFDKYLNAGIETDHECYMLEEAQEKMKKGMKIIVREGSAAKNLSEIYPVLLNGKNMLCTDDSHPDDLMKGHMNKILEKCVRIGISPMAAIKSATKNIVEHYGLTVGLLRKWDPADIAVVDNLRNFNVLETWINGKKIYDGKNSKIKKIKEKPINRFFSNRVNENDLKIKHPIPVIEAIDKSLITNKYKNMDSVNAKLDILKIVVLNRYKKAKPAVGLVKNFGLKKGAFGSSFMHDSHNIGVVGVDDDSIIKVIDEIKKLKGGVVVYDGKEIDHLKLPFGGLMANEHGENVAKKYEQLTKKVKRMGCKMRAPFMTLSFMGLLVIPHLKISDEGVFDGDKFEFATR